MDYLTTHTSPSPIRHEFALGFVRYKKGCTRLASANDKVYQVLVYGRWVSPGTPASSITKTGPHDIAEILLKVALNTKNQIKNQIMTFMVCHIIHGMSHYSGYATSFTICHIIQGMSHHSQYATLFRVHVLYNVPCMSRHLWYMSCHSRYVTLFTVCHV